MSTGYLYICVVLNFFHYIIISYNLQSTGLLPPWLNSFLDILFFCDAIVHGIAFLICHSDRLLLVYRITTDFCIILYPAKVYTK